MNDTRLYCGLLGKLIVLAVIIGGIILLLDPLETNLGILPFLDRVSDSKASDEINEKLTKKEYNVGQVFQRDGGGCLISVPDKARTINGKKEPTYILALNDCKYAVNEYVDVVFEETLPNVAKNEDTGVSDKDVTASNESSEPSNNGETLITVKPHKFDQTFDNLSLSSTRHGDSVIVRYHDTSEDTNSATITIRNSQKEIFSGKFISSKFETSVKGVSKDTPYVIEMIVDHAVQGKLVSSMYNPPGKDDALINGIFQRK